MASDGDIWSGFCVCNPSSLPNRKRTEHFCLVHRRFVCLNCIAPLPVGHVRREFQSQHPNCPVVKYHEWTENPSEDFQFPPCCSLCGEGVEKENTAKPATAGRAASKAPLRLPCFCLFHRDCFERSVRAKLPTDAPPAIADSFPCPNCTKPLSAEAGPSRTADLLNQMFEESTLPLRASRERHQSPTAAAAAQHQRPPALGSARASSGLGDDGVPLFSAQGGVMSRSSGLGVAALTVGASEVHVAIPVGASAAAAASGSGGASHDLESEELPSKARPRRKRRPSFSKDRKELSRSRLWLRRIVLIAICFAVIYAVITVFATLFPGRSLSDFARPAAREEADAGGVAQRAGAAAENIADGS